MHPLAKLAKRYLIFFRQNLAIPAIVNFFTLLLKLQILNHLTYDYGQGLICTTTFTISKHCRLGTQRAPQMCSFYVNLPRLWAAPAALPKWPQTSWKTWEMVFCYQNCSDLLWEKIVLEIEKKFWNSKLKAENLKFLWDH